MGNNSKNIFQSNNLKSFKDALKWWNYVRWLSTISFLSVGIIQISLSGFGFPIYAFALTLLAITLLNIAYSLWVDNFKYNLTFPLIHNFMDIIIFSLAIFMTGGIKSPFLWGYLIPILTSSITIGRRAGLMASLLSILGLLSVSYFSDTNFIVGLQKSYDIFNISKIDSKTLLSFACLFFLVYFISSFLANTLRTQNLDLIELNKELKEKNQLILESQEKLVEMQRKETIYETVLTLQHEINNPLAILSLNTEMLQKESNGNLNKRLVSISDSVQRIKNILDKIKLLKNDKIKSRTTIDGIKILDLKIPDLIE